MMDGGGALIRRRDERRRRSSKFYAEKAETVRQKSMPGAIIMWGVR